MTVALRTGSDGNSARNPDLVEFDEAFGALGPWPDYAMEQETMIPLALATIDRNHL